MTTYNTGSCDEVLELGVAELERDDVEKTVLVLLLVVALPLLHRHLQVLLSVDVHHVQLSPGT